MKTNRKNPSVLDRFMSKISADELELTEKKMHLASRIDEAISQKNLKKQEFANMLGKQPSEISKWLSGTHNFTIETLWQIEKKLGISLVNWQPNVRIATISYSVIPATGYPVVDGPKLLTNRMEDKNAIYPNDEYSNGSIQPLIAS